MSFRTDRYYVVLPKAELLCLADKHGLVDLIDDGRVLSTTNHSHTGNEQTPTQVEEALWTRFVGAFDFSQEPEPNAAKQFLRECMSLGFTGCWQLLELEGGSAAEFVSKAEGRKAAAAENLKAIGM